MIFPFSVIFSQRNASNKKFDEKYVSGSNIVFGTDKNGLLAGLSLSSLIDEISSSFGLASTGSNTFNGDQTISGSLIVTNGISGSGGNISTINLNVNQSISASSATFSYLQLNFTGSAPTNPTDIGNNGELRLDENFIYIYMIDKWKRIPTSIWD